MQRGDSPSTCKSCGHTPVQPRQRWKRVLYLKQPYPDDYVDSSFLQAQSEQQAQRGPPPSYWQTCLYTAAITQRVSVVILLAGIFFELWSSRASAYRLLLVDAAALVVLGIQAITSATRDTLSDGLAIVRAVLLLGVVLFVFSPILQTLTLSYSSDTIWALSIVLSLLHVCFHDYHYINSAIPTELQGFFSLNAGIFASVLLASRLHSALEVYAFMSAAFLTHIGFPIFAGELRRQSTLGHVVATVGLFGITAITLQTHTTILMHIYAASVAFVTFVVPFYLKWVHQYKHEIRGMWDYDSKAELETI